VATGNSSCLSQILVWAPLTLIQVPVTKPTGDFTERRRLMDITRKSREIRPRRG